jgi:hypothetical protein
MHVAETFHKGLNRQLGATHMLNAICLEYVDGDRDRGSARDQALTHQRRCYTVFCGLELHINGGGFLKRPSAGDILPQKGRTEHIHHPNLVDLLHGQILLVWRRT